VAALRICLVGATGLIGSRLIAECVGRSDVHLSAITRREMDLPRGARMEVLVADPATGWADAIAATNAKALVCALGTTWRKAGKDEAAFRAVDHDLVLTCARAAKAAGIDHFVLISSAGADPRSSQLYLRVKGEVEQAVGKLHFRRLDVLRPGLLRGRRENDRRLLERIGIAVAPLTDLMLNGQRARFRSVLDVTVARAIIGLAKERAMGRFVHEGEAILRAAHRGISAPAG
jgi:uncharacterized protein YbjT (DUF2867 family)